MSVLKGTAITSFRDAWDVMIVDLRREIGVPKETLNPDGPLVCELLSDIIHQDTLPDDDLQFLESFQKTLPGYAQARVLSDLPEHYEDIKTYFNASLREKLQSHFPQKQVHPEQTPAFLGLD